MADLDGLLATLGLMHPQAVQRTATAMPKATTADYGPGYNDHSTSDKWAALLGGLVPSLAPLANRIIQGHQAQNAMVASRYQGDQLANALSGGFGAPAASAPTPVAPTASPSKAVPDALAGLVGQAAPTLPTPANPSSKYDASPQGAMSYFTDKGYPAPIAAAIAGNFGPESAGWNPKAVNPAGGGQGAFGLGQWRGPRLAALRQFAAQTGRDPGDPSVQYDFTDKELQTSHKGVLQALNGVGDAGTAALIFSKTFEAPGNVPQSYLDRIRNEGLKAMQGFTPASANGPAAQVAPDAPAVAQNAAPAAAAVPPDASGAPPATPAPASADDAKEALLHASPSEVAAFKAMYANPATRAKGVDYATDLIKKYASGPDYEASLNQNSGQVIHYSKDPAVKAIVENVTGVLPAPPSKMMWDPDHPGRAIPIPGTAEGPPQAVQGAVGVFQRDPFGHYEHMGDQPFGSTPGGSAPAPARAGGAPGVPGAATTGLPPNTFRVPGATGIWAMDPSGKPIRVADDGQAATSPSANPNLTGEDFLKSQPPVRAAQIKALSEGRMQIPGGIATKVPYWQQMIADTAQYDPMFDASNYYSRVATRKDFTSGPSSKNVTSMNTTLGHLAKLDASIDEMGNYSGPASILNGPVNLLYDKGLGSPRFSDFVANKKAVADELTRVFRGTGGSEKDIQAQMDSLNRDRSPEQLHQTVRALSGLLDSRLSAMGDAYNRGMQTSEDPITLLSPEAQRTLTRFRGDPSGGGSGTSQPVAATGAPPPPRPGAVQQGYKFNGGNPADPHSWTKVQ